MKNVAVIYGKDKITFNQILSDIRACVLSLSNKIDNKQDRIGVGIRSDYWHWVMTLALLQIGKECATVYDPKNLPEEILQTFDAWIGVDNDSVKNIIYEFDPNKIKFNNDEIEINLFEQENVSEIDRLPLKLGRQAGRILMTSGTTGLPKLITLSADDLQLRLKALDTQYRNEYNHHSRLLPLIGIDTVGTFFMTLLTWMRGGTVLMGVPTEDNQITQIPYESSNIITASPAILSNILRNSQGIWPGQHQRQVRVGGSRLHAALRDEALKRICSHVQSTYGSTELGIVATCDATSLNADPGAAGQVFDNVTVEIVDIKHNVLPYGVTGFVRCKSPGMAKFYENMLISHQFRNGWFYPGDIGRLSESGWLTITGRDSDVINLGGGKFSAVELETNILDSGEFNDVCVVSIDDKNGFSIAIAVVTNDELDLNNSKTRIDLLLPFKFKYHLIRVPYLPRNSMGKLPRNEIAEKIQSILNEKA